MENIFFIIYYQLTLASLLIYFGGLKVLKLRLVTFSSYFYCISFVLVMLPGYFVAAGTVDDIIFNNFNRGFDFELFLIYILLLIYGLLYFMWLPVNPLNTLIMTGDLSSAYEARMKVTHGLNDQFDLPFLFRYWRTVLQLVSLVIFLLYIYVYREKNIKTVFVKLLLFFFVVYNFIFTLEKAPFLNFMLILLFMSVFLNGIRINKIFNIRNLLLGFSGVFVLSFIMNIEMVSFFDYILPRLAKQTSSNYLQIEIIRQDGFLGLSGIKSKWLMLLEIDYIDTSKMVMNQLDPNNVGKGLIGAAGGMSLSQLYFSLGSFAFPIYFLFIFSIGFSDNIILKSIFHKSNRSALEISAVFYSVFSVWYSEYALSSIFAFYSATYVLSPETFILLLIYFLFIKIPIRF